MDVSFYDRQGVELRWLKHVKEVNFSRGVLTFSAESGSVTLLVGEDKIIELDDDEMPTDLEYYSVWMREVD
jgi:hypothetical protein